MLAIAFHFSMSDIARPARLVSPFIALAALIWLGACSDPQPPVACETIPQQTLNVGQSGSVTPCFEDPEMAPIRLSAESSDDAIAGVSVAGDRVNINGNSPGTATITVTATDPDSLTGQTRFEVLVPNRPPVSRGTIPHVLVPPGRSSLIVLSRYFTEPDGQEMTYSAEFSDQGVASGAVTGDVLAVAGVSVGTTAGTATATDAGGLSASQAFSVTVVEARQLLRDDFESDESLDNWEVSDSSNAQIEDGTLLLENVASGYLGFASTSLAASSWEVTAALGNTSDNVWAGLMVGADHPRFSAYLILIGADDDDFGFGETDYRFFVFDDNGPFWTYTDDWYGQSDAIADVGDLTSIGMAVDGGVLTVTAESSELLRVDLAANGFSDVSTFFTLATWPAGATTGQRGVFDWVEATGIELEDEGAAMRPAVHPFDLAAPVRGFGSRDRIRRLDGEGWRAHPPAVVRKK